MSRNDARWENGKPVEVSSAGDAVVEKATRSADVVGININTLMPPPDAPEPETGFSQFNSNVQFVIEPEAGEAVGQCVLVD